MYVEFTFLGDECRVQFVAISSHLLAWIVTNWCQSVKRNKEWKSEKLRNYVNMKFPIFICTWNLGFCKFSFFQPWKKIKLWWCWFLSYLQLNMSKIKFGFSIFSFISILPWLNFQWLNSLWTFAVIYNNFEDFEDLYFCLLSKSH